MKFNIIQKIKDYCDDSEANVFKLTAAATTAVAIPLFGYVIGSNIVQGDVFDVAVHSVQLTGIMLLISKLISSAKIISKYEDLDFEKMNDLDSSLAFFKNELVLLKQAKKANQICFGAFALVNLIYIIESIVNPTASVICSNAICFAVNAYFSAKSYKRAKSTNVKIERIQENVDYYEDAVEEQRKLLK